MRTVITFAVIGLALGLAAPMLPRVLEHSASGFGAGEGPSGFPPAPSSPAQSARERGVVAPSVKSREAGTGVGSEEARFANPNAASEVRADAAGTNRAPNLEQVQGAVDREAFERKAVERLTVAGFTAERAREIVRRESELRRESIKAEYAATGTIRPLNASAPSAASRKLRKELGDKDYEKYLQATGRPTRVRVGAVESGSAAESAGIRSGDEILSYAGRRVFDPGELSAMMQETSIGDTVATTVVRDGQTLKLYVTGGPLGISQRPAR